MILANRWVDFPAPGSGNQNVCWQDTGREGKRYRLPQVPYEHRRVRVGHMDDMDRSAKPGGLSQDQLGLHRRDLR